MSWDNDLFKPEENEIETTGTLKFHKLSYEALHCLGPGEEISPSENLSNFAVLRETIEPGAMEFLLFDQALEEETNRVLQEGHRFFAQVSGNQLSLLKLSDFQTAAGVMQEQTHDEPEAMVLSNNQKDTMKISKFLDNNLKGFLIQNLCLSGKPIYYLASGTIPLGLQGSKSVKIVMSSKSGKMSHSTDQEVAPPRVFKSIFMIQLGKVHRRQVWTPAEWLSLDSSEIYFEGDFLVSASANGSLFVSNKSLQLEPTPLSMKALDDNEVKTWLGDSTDRVLAIAPHCR